MEKKPICEHCGEYTKCVCSWDKCALCGVRYSNFDADETHQIFEYRGVLGCGKCIDEVREKRDAQRARVMEITEHAVSSQRKSHFVNNISDKKMKFAEDGLPIIKINEPLVLQEYEAGKL